jgi:hypothetical protein
MIDHFKTTARYEGIFWVWGAKNPITLLMPHAHTRV